VYLHLTSVKCTSQCLRFFTLSFARFSKFVLPVASLVGEVGLGMKTILSGREEAFISYVVSSRKKRCLQRPVGSISRICAFCCEFF
jgi:hypothetical protein